MVTNADNFINHIHKVLNPESLNWVTPHPSDIDKKTEDVPNKKVRKKLKN